MPLFYYAQIPGKFDRSEVLMAFRYIDMAEQFRLVFDGKICNNN